MLMQWKLANVSLSLHSICWSFLFLDVVVCQYGLWGQKRVSDPLGLESLDLVMSYWRWMLGTKLRSSGENIEY